PAAADDRRSPHVRGRGGDGHDLRGAGDAPGVAGRPAPRPWRGRSRPAAGGDDAARLVARPVRARARRAPAGSPARRREPHDLPERWRPLAPWVEQVVEESLGKGGRGLLVFHGQVVVPGWPDRHAVLRVDEGGGLASGAPCATLRLAGGLVAAARIFAGWELT